LLQETDFNACENNVNEEKVNQSRELCDEESSAQTDESDDEEPVSVEKARRMRHSFKRQSFTKKVIISSDSFKKSSAIGSPAKKSFKEITTVLAQTEDLNYKDRRIQRSSVSSISTSTSGNTETTTPTTSTLISSAGLSDMDELLTPSMSEAVAVMKVPESPQVPSLSSLTLNSPQSSFSFYNKLTRSMSVSIDSIKSTVNVSSFSTYCREDSATTTAGKLEKRKKIPPIPLDLSECSTIDFSSAMTTASALSQPTPNTETFEQRQHNSNNSIMISPGSGISASLLMSQNTSCFSQDTTNFCSSQEDCEAVTPSVDIGPMNLMSPHSASFSSRSCEISSGSPLIFSSNDDGWGGSSSQPPLMPSHYINSGRNNDISIMDANRLQAFILEQKTLKDVPYTIVDCRFPYEFNAGHIVGAVNVYCQNDLETLFAEISHSIEKRILIFHCEYSSRRGPNICERFRQLDRTFNLDKYPHLSVPKLYILLGGYKQFFEKYMSLCDPVGYVPMDAPEFSKQCSSFLRMFSRESKKRCL